MRCATPASAVELIRTQGYAVMSGADASALADTLDDTRKKDAVEVSAGRLHYEMTRRLRKRDERVRGVIDEAVAPQLRALAAAYLGTDNVRLTQVQFLDSLPDSAAQIWHCDNAERGLTFILPLERIGSDMGPTEVLPRSHLGDWRAFATTRRRLVGPVSTGEVVCFDARLLHRGGANESRRRRRVLVLRYDDRATPPPGVGVVGTAFRRCVAHGWAQLGDLAGM